MRREAVAGWLIGLFAAWQLVFPVLANLLEFVPVRPPDDEPLERTQRYGRFTSDDTLQSVVEHLGVGVGWYAQITGQEQGWDMFTPGFPPHTVVPLAELTLPDGTNRRVFSRFDPLAFRQPWLRPPFVFGREFNVEANLFMPFWHFDPRGKSDLSGVVTENRELLARWLDWQRRRCGATDARLVLRFLPQHGGEPVELPVPHPPADGP